MGKENGFLVRTCFRWFLRSFLRCCRRCQRDTFVVRSKRVFPRLVRLLQPPSHRFCKRRFHLCSSQFHLLDFFDASKKNLVKFSLKFPFYFMILCRTCFVLRISCLVHFLLSSKVIGPLYPYSRSLFTRTLKFGVAVSKALCARLLI